MPCMWEGPEDEARRLVKELNETTRMLCGVCRSLEQSGHPIPEVSGLKAWWERHKRADQARKAKEDEERSKLLDVSAAIARSGRDSLELMDRMRIGWSERVANFAKDAAFSMVEEFGCTPLDALNEIANAMNRRIQTFSLAWEDLGAHIGPAVSDARKALRKHA